MPKKNRKMKLKVPKLPIKKLGIVTSVLIIIFLIIMFREIIFCNYPTIVMHYKMRYNQMSIPDYLERLRIYAREELEDPIDELNYTQLIGWIDRHLDYWEGPLQVRPEMPIDILKTNLWGTVRMKNSIFIRDAIYCTQTGQMQIYLTGNETLDDVEPDSWEWSGLAVGRCGEFALLFNGLLLANNYRSRIVVDCSISTDGRKAGDHLWNEIFLNGTWVHIETTEACEDYPYVKPYINHPEIYSSPDRFNKCVNKVYAIEGNEITDVTSTYARN